MNAESPTIVEQLQRGFSLQQTGQTAAAEKSYRDVLLRDPTNVHALNLLGALYVNSHRSPEALPLLEKALQRDASDVDTWKNWGLALTHCNDYDRAIQAFTRALQLRPADPVTHTYLGNVLGTVGRVEEAIKAYRHALQLAPDYAECASNLATALLSTGQLSGALEAAERALRSRPRLAEAHNTRGEVMRKRYRYEAAIECYRAALTINPDYGDASINLALTLKEVGEVSKAREVLSQVLKTEPANAYAHTSLGSLLEQLGEADHAQACFRRALQILPSHAQAYYQLSRLGGAVLTDADVAAMAALSDDSRTPLEDRRPLGFALAAAHEARGDIARSFSYLASAHAAKADKAPYSDAAAAEYYGAIKQVFNTPPSTRAKVADGTTRPIFVIGMPRSGTSLVEQILTSHPSIKGAGEVSFVDDALEDTKRLTGVAFPHSFQLLSNGQLQELGRDYLKRLEARAGKALWLVDKTPMNFQYVGFIASILPDALFIHCVRNPIDNCLSIYKLPFDDDHTYAHTLASLGQFYRRYADIMGHWSRVLPGRMLAVQYEQVVADLEAQCRNVLSFLGVPFDPVVLQFHANPRIVKTPSAGQVRRPIYSSSVNSSTKFMPFLAPLVASLESDHPTAERSSGLSALKPR